MIIRCVMMLSLIFCIHFSIKYFSLNFNTQTFLAYFNKAQDIYLDQFCFLQLSQLSELRDLHKIRNKIMNVLSYIKFFVFTFWIASMQSFLHRWMSKSASWSIIWVQRVILSERLIFKAICIASAIPSTS